MKIVMDTTDIEKLLTAYLPQNMQYSGDKLQVCLGRTAFTLGHTNLTLNTEVEYDKLNADLACQLADWGAEIAVKLK